jgi:hypothetical protein
MDCFVGYGQRSGGKDFDDQNGWWDLWRATFSFWPIFRDWQGLERGSNGVFGILSFLVAPQFGYQSPRSKQGY